MTHSLRTIVRVALCIAVIVTYMYTLAGAIAPAFTCGTTSVCNLEPEQPDQFCTSGPEGRCKSCSDNPNRCFTEHMPFNCTNYCRELDHSAILAAAKENACSILGNVTNGYHNATNSLRPGASVLITCHSGYRVEGNDVIRCLEFGVWSVGLPYCAEIVCTSPVIPNGDVQRDNPTALVGQYLLYKCNKGYGPDDPKSQALCLPDGTWRAATCHKLNEVTTDSALVWRGLLGGIAVLVCALIALIAILIKLCLENKHLKRDAKENGCDRRTPDRNGYKPAKTENPNAPLRDIVVCNNETIDGKKTKDKPLPPRDNNTVRPDNPLSPEHEPLIDDASRPSMTTDSFEPTAVPEPDPPPSADDNKTHGNSPSGSDENAADKTTVNRENVKVTINLINTTNGNNTIIDKSSNTKVNGVLHGPYTINAAKDDTNIGEKDAYPDTTPYSTQASGDGAAADNSDMLHGGACNYEPTNNVDNGGAAANPIRHAQPTDDGKDALMALPNNTVPPEDVKLGSKSSS